MYVSLQLHKNIMKKNGLLFFLKNNNIDNLASHILSLILSQID
jgi:hypothetical protein